MSLLSTYRPSNEDFFPSVVRGHSSGAHSKHIKQVQVDAEGKSSLKVIATRKPFCVADQCSLNSPKSKSQHIDKAQNITSWEEERNMKLSSIMKKFNQNGLVSISAAA